MDYWQLFQYLPNITIFSLDSRFSGPPGFLSESHFSCISPIYEILKKLLVITSSWRCAACSLLSRTPRCVKDKQKCRGEYLKTCETPRGEERGVMSL